MNRANDRIAFVLCLLCGILLAGPPARAQQTTAPPEPHERPLSGQEEKKLRKKEKKEKIALDKARSKGAPQDVPALFAKAQELMRKKSWVAAREALLVLEDNPDALSLQPEVKLAIADSYFGERGLLNYVEAISRYRNFLTYYPNHPKADYAQLRIADSYWAQRAKADRDQSQVRNALSEYQKLLELHPNSPQAADAETRIRECRERLAEHELEIGKFYYARGVHDAAIPRLQGIVAEYPEFGQRGVVYHMLAQSFYKIGSKAEGDVYRRKFEETGGRAGFDVPREPAAPGEKARTAAEKERRRKEQQMLDDEKEAEKRRRKQGGGGS